jgi:hypothetical protein
LDYSKLNNGTNDPSALAWTLTTADDYFLTTLYVEKRLSFRPMFPWHDSQKIEISVLSKLNAFRGFLKSFDSRDDRGARIIAKRLNNIQFNYILTT